MKTLMIAGISCLLFSCKKQDKIEVPVEQPVTKNISFRIVAEVDFTAQRYVNSFARIEMFISKFDSVTSLTTSLYDSVIDFKPIAQFNASPFPFTINKSFSQLLDSRNRLRVGYIVANETREYGFNNPSAYGEGYWEHQGNVSDTVHVRLN